jgi:hypothetical protein
MKRKQLDGMPDGASAIDLAKERRTEMNIIVTVKQSRDLRYASQPAQVPAYGIGCSRHGARNRTNTAGLCSEQVLLRPLPLPTGDCS